MDVEVLINDCRFRRELEQAAISLFDEPSSFRTAQSTSMLGGGAFGGSVLCASSCALPKVLANKKINMPSFARISTPQTPGPRHPQISWRDNANIFTRLQPCDCVDVRSLQDLCEELRARHREYGFVPK